MTHHWVAASARNLADWHDSSLRALGVDTLRTDALWSRKATRPPKPNVPELDIKLVEDVAALEEFGIATWEGFETEEVNREAGPLGMHHPSTLNDPRMRYFVVSVAGRVVTSAIAYVGDDIVGIYGVSTLPEYRRRGYGKAITWAAAMSAPELDVAVSPDEEARGIERELGFRKIAEYRAWGKKSES